MTREHVVLIDGSGFIFRAFYGLPPMTRDDGVPVNAVYGFANMLMKLLRELEADRIAVIFDKSGTTFRNDIYPEYKANRSETPEDLIPQFALIRDATRAFNLPCIEKEGFEADDIIATYARLAREAGAQVTIVSSDKDMMQLIGDQVTMLDGLKDRRIGPAEVVEKFGVGPERVIDVQALAGDSSDNVPGVPGIGVKTAAELINRFGDLDAVLERAEEITQPKRRESLIANAEAARMSRRLVTLVDDVALEDGLADLHAGPPDVATLTAFLTAQNFRGIVGRVEAWLGAAPDTGAGDEVVEAEAERDYELVQDMAALERWIAEARTAGAVTVDCETTSLDSMAAKLVGVSLSAEPGRACYIPLGHGAPREGELGLDAAAAPKQIGFQAALDQLGPLLADKSVLKIGQNIKYDMAVLARYGLTVSPVEDTMLLSYVLDGGSHGHGMDELSRIHLAIDPVPFKSVVGSGKKQITFDQVPLDAARDYAAEDADITGRLHGVLKPRLVAESMVTVYETLERPLIPVLVEMERAGIKVDRAALEALSRDFETRIAAYGVEIHRLAGREFTIGSPKQLGEVLFDEMGLTGGKKSKTGAYSTDASVLEALAAEGHDLPARVLGWRQLAKLKSTYTDALVARINPGTGRVHTSFSMAAAATGRLASTDPNLQNIPIRSEEGRKIRHAFIAEAGHKLLSADYSQIELRLAAHVAGVDSLKRAFHDGLDIHAMTASEVFGVPIEGMDPMIRRRAKAINFGIIYGISPFGLARQLDISQGDAKAYIEAYFGRFPEIRDYMERTKEICRKQGYVTTLFGRRCHLPGINDKNPARRGFNERAAINAPLQGGAADIIKRAMIRMPAALEAEGLAARMLLQVHDELIFEVPDDEVEATASAVKQVMESAAHLSVPLVVDTGVADSWADAH
ncbi:MAG: DNA polymerase I [Alphaproteobacteria bacterium]